MYSTPRARATNACVDTFVSWRYLPGRSIQEDRAAVLLGDAADMRSSIRTWLRMKPYFHCEVSVSKTRDHAVHWPPRPAPIGPGETAARLPQRALTVPIPAIPGSWWDMSYITCTGVAWPSIRDIHHTRPGSEYRKYRRDAVSSSNGMQLSVVRWIAFRYAAVLEARACVLRGLE